MIAFLYVVLTVLLAVVVGAIWTVAAIGMHDLLHES